MIVVLGWERVVLMSTVITFRYRTEVVLIDNVVLVDDEDYDKDEEEDDDDQHPYHQGHVGGGYDCGILTLIRNIITLIMYLPNILITTTHL